MAKKLKNPNDVKIFILYLLKNVKKPLLFNDLTQIVLQDEYVDYLAFAECLAELCDGGNLKQTSTEEGDLYELTPQGAVVADELQSDIATFVRTQSLKSALRYLNFKEKGIRVPVTSAQIEDGKYEMAFEIKENGASLLRLELTVDNDYMERQMRYNFQNEPERIYRSILALLTGESDYLLK